MQPFDFNACQLQACRKVEMAGRDAGRLLLALKQVTAQAEIQMAGAAEFEPGLIDCRPGCGTCCVVNVSTLLPEGLAVVDHLLSLPESQRAAIIDRLDELWRAVRGLTDDERISLRQPCAFLDDSGNCRIYPVRPLLCRSITSTSAESCRQALADHYFDEQSTVLMNLFQQQLYESIYLGVGEGLEANGLEARSVKLTGLVRHLLKKPQSGREFLDGKKFDWHEFA